MAKLTKFKAQQVEFGTHYKIEETNRGDTKIKSITPAFGNIREPGTPETEEIYNGLQLGNVHTLQAIKSTNLNIDYYICNLEGLTEFGLNNDLKLRITVDNANTNTTTKLRLNNVDYTLLKEQNGTLKQIEAGDIHLNKTYELIYNGSQFVVINLFKNFESSYLDNCIKKTDYATENKAGIVTLGTTANTALEGKRLAEILGIEFGGKIQDSGTKTAGKFYYDTVTKLYYECIMDNNLTYNDSSKFRAISNKPISDRLEKLFQNANGGFNFANLVFKSGNGRYRKSDWDRGTRILFGTPFDNKCLFVVAQDNNVGAYSVAVLSFDRESFKVIGRDNNKQLADTDVNWFAVGY
jgi:hypothetical protein|nr:MAG TPA: putative tail fiber protein [Caudoviricetes sp.]